MGLLNTVGNPMKRVFSLLTPTATIAAILISGITPAQAEEVVLTSMFNSVVVQLPKSFNQQEESDPPPPAKGSPGGSRIAQPPVVLPKEAL